MTLPNYWKSILWSAFIFTILLIPGDKIPKNRFYDIGHFDKLAHLILFAILEFLVLIEGKVSRHYSKNYLLPGLYGLLLAGVSEMLQKLPHLGRQADVNDFIADVLGLLLGALAFRIMSDLKFLSFLRK